MKQFLFLGFCIIYSTMSSQNSFIKYYNLETPYGNIHGMCKINNEIIATGIAWDTSYKPNRHNIFLFKCDLKGNLLKKDFIHEDTSMYIISTTGALYFPCIEVINNDFVILYNNFSKKSTEILQFNVDFMLKYKNIIEPNIQPSSIFPIKLLIYKEKLIIGASEYSGHQSNNKSYIYIYDSNLNFESKKNILTLNSIRALDLNLVKSKFLFSEFNNGDKYLITDTAFKTLKEIKLKNGLSDVYHERIRYTSDGGFLSTSYNLNGTQNFSLNIVKRDSMVNTQWKFGMGGIPGQMAAVADIIPSSDDAYFAYGQIGIRTSDINDADPGRDSFDIRIFSTVKFRDDGKIIWQRFDTLETGYFNESYAHCGGMVAADDGGLYVSGDVTCYDTVRVDGILKRRTDYKHFLMKIDSNGCVDGLHCNVEPKTETVLSVQPSFPSDAGKMTVYPNPTTGIVTVDPGMAVTKGMLTVYNTLGEVVAIRSLAGDEQGIQLNLSGQPSGQYYVTLRRNDGKMVKASFMIFK